MDADVINKAIDEAIAEANEQGIKGKETTPFLLAKIKDITGGSSLAANIQLVYNNVKLAAQIAANWATLFSQAHRADTAAGFTTVGAHREDLDLRLDGVPAKVYGSQGQQRSAVLALKLAEASLLQEITGEAPVAFLDDVMSELDVSRQDYILNHIDGWQVFITCCEPTAALRMNAGKVFQIKNGVIE